MGLLCDEKESFCWCVFQLLFEQTLCKYAFYQSMCRAKRTQPGVEKLDNAFDSFTHTS